MFILSCQPTLTNGIGRQSVECSQTNRAGWYYRSMLSQHSCWCCRWNCSDMSVIQYISDMSMTYWWGVGDILVTCQWHDNKMVVILIKVKCLKLSVVWCVGQVSGKYRSVVGCVSVIWSSVGQVYINWVCRSMLLTDCWTVWQSTVSQGCL